jgi:hypothetical protein
MYFNHAFRKSFLPATSQGSFTLRTTGNTSNLTAGQVGFFDSRTFAALAAPSAAPFLLAQGSYFATDKIGGNRFLGGYQESVKSKVINPKYITRLIEVGAVSPRTQIRELCVCNLECGKTYRLRIDLKGSPALRFLSHNIYSTQDAFTGCCTDDCSATCTGALVDPTIAVIAWAKRLLTNPLINNFIKLYVKDYTGAVVATQAVGPDGSPTQAGIDAFIVALDAYLADPAGNHAAWDPTSQTASTDQACLGIEAAYVDTKFLSCTFTPTDFYELMPLFIFASLTDETGDACNVQCFDDSELQTPLQASGLGETILRQMILDGRYLQNAYPDSTRVDSLRMREIEADPALATINRQGLYDQLLILHSVPRFNNPTGTFDNDQYLLVVHVPTGTSTTAMSNFILGAAAAAGNNDLVLETV